jgi:hypothetical protein
MPDGGTEHRQLTAADLRAAASGAVSSRPARAAFQRALNAAVDGDLVPLARLADDGDHPSAGSAEADRGFSWGLYYAVECANRRWVPAGSSPRRQLDTWLAAAARAGIDGERLGQVFYGDLPCLVWPGAAAQPRVAPAVPADPPYPVLLLTADTDPNTPTANALRVFARARADTALVLLTGGPHVVYGWGYGCVDDVVTGVVTSGRLPARPETVCTGPVAEGYQPAPPATAAGWTTAEHSLDLVAAAVLGDSTYQAWDGGDPFTVGCDAGGTARYGTDADGTVHVALDRCALTPGVPLDGSFEVTDGGRGDVSATLRLPFGRLVLAAGGTLSGTFRGRPAG